MVPMTTVLVGILDFSFSCRFFILLSEFGWFWFWFWSSYSRFGVADDDEEEVGDKEVEDEEDEEEEDEDEEDEEEEDEDEVGPNKSAFWELKNETRAGWDFKWIFRILTQVPGVKLLKISFDCLSIEDVVIAKVAPYKRFSYDWLHDFNDGKDSILLFNNFKPLTSCAKQWAKISPEYNDFFILIILVRGMAAVGFR